VHRTVVVVVVALAVLASCMKKKRDEGASREAEQVTGAEPPPVTSVDEMIRRSFDQAGPGYYVAEIEIDYVRADGTLDPTYGELTVKTGKRRPPKPPKPADDPNRPVGAPEPPSTAESEYVDMIMAKCPELHWTPAGLKPLPGASCSIFTSTELARPHCTVFGILGAAAAAGAPANALAKIEFHIGYGTTVQSWEISIDDNPRGIHFHHEGADDCAPIVEKP